MRNFVPADHGTNEVAAGHVMNRSIRSFDGVAVSCRREHCGTLQVFTLAVSARLMRVKHRPVLARAHKTGRISWEPVAARLGGIGKLSDPVGVYLFPDGKRSPHFLFY